MTGIKNTKRLIILFIVSVYFLTSCNLHNHVKYHIGKYAVFNKPHLTEVKFYKRHFSAMYKKVNWDSILLIEDTAYMLLVYNGHYSNYAQFIYFRHKDFSLWSGLHDDSFVHDTIRNFGNSIRLSLMMNRNIDSSQLRPGEYYTAKRAVDFTIPILITRNKRGKIISYIIK